MSSPIQSSPLPSSILNEGSREPKKNRGVVFSDGCNLPISIQKTPLQSKRADNIINRIRKLQKNELLHFAKVINRLSKGYVEEVKKELMITHKTKLSTSLIFVQRFALSFWNVCQNTNLNQNSKQEQRQLKATLCANINEKRKLYDSIQTIEFAHVLDILNYRPLKLFEKLALTIQAGIYLERQEHKAIHAFRKLTPLPEDFFREMIDKIDLEKITIYQLGIVLTSLAEANYQALDFFEEASLKIKQKTSQFKANETQLLLEAYASIKWDSQKNTNEEKINQFNTQIVSSLRPGVIENLKKFTEHQLVQIVWSLKKLKVDDLDIFLKLSAEVEKRIHQFNSQQITLLTQSLCSTQGLQNRSITRQLCHQVRERSDFTSIQTVTILDALLFDYCLSNEIQSLIELLFLRISEFQTEINSGNLPNWKVPDLSRIYIAYCLYCLKTKERPKLPVDLLQELATYVKSEKSKNCSINISEFQDEVEFYLNKLNMKEKFDKEFFINGFRVDFAYLQSKVVIEVDGPTHFKLNSLNHREREIVKEKMLEMSGWKLFRISYHQWDKMKKLNPSDPDKLIISYLHKKFNLTNS